MILFWAVNDKVSVNGNTPGMVMRHKFPDKYLKSDTTVTSYSMTVSIIAGAYSLTQDWSS
jgi:hypothetical protein